MGLKEVVDKVADKYADVIIGKGKEYGLIEGRSRTEIREDFLMYAVAGMVFGGAAIVFAAGFLLEPYIGFTPRARHLRQQAYQQQKETPAESPLEK